jgi:murein DD-endopeptidase MepM/ murein hydrolase activator NlpD
VDDELQRMRAVRFCLVVVAVCALWWNAGSAEAVDSRVERARAELDAARAARDATADDLDRAAAAFEEARAHAERLADEADDTERAVTQAHGVAAEADGVLRERLLMLFKNPGMRADALASATLAGSVGEALHRVELVEQLAQYGAQDRNRANRSLVRVRDAEHDYRVVTAGVREALRSRRDRAADLGVALGRAQRRVDTAREGIREAEQEAERERRRRERERAVAGHAGPLPPVNGMTCPIAVPNAFSDTWGAPRSGGRSHKGVDMFAAHGAPLYAVADGTVRTSHSTLGGMSIHLTTDTGDRYYYAHLSASLVTSGQRVRTGQPIGANGNSGNARGTPPHLHWQYHPGGGAAVNPYPLAFALCRS